MVLHDAAHVFRTDGFPDIGALLITENNTAIARIDGQIVVEQASILLHDIDRLAERGPSFSV